MTEILIAIFGLAILIAFIGIRAKINSIDEKYSEFLRVASESVDLSNKILSDWNNSVTELSQVRDMNIKLIRENSNLLKMNHELSVALQKATTKIEFDCSEFSDSINSIKKELNKNE